MTVEARAITVSLGGKPILRDVDLDVRPGECLGLVGPNGAGKTTLLRVLAGLSPPAGGTVRYDGETAAALGRQALARRVAYLAQGGEAAWPLSVEAVVGLGRLPYRRPFSGLSPADDAAIARALQACDAADLGDRTLGTLSGGEQRRVLLARALAVEALYLLADEPLAGLDPLHQLEVMELLRRTARGGAGVVVVLHDLTLAARFCDRLALIDRGRLVAAGPPAEVLDDRRLKAVFGIAVLRGSHEGEPFLLPWGVSHDR
ncbi:ABC transporter ATP-binding protein [Bosea sp. (in: a-proteobacteria)]|uniref:ABC transporter ATP-binding protein n=1 Tax=Bosea sp. (in: a-proteobacteria) TaxID=1871050 RepID=UPI00261C738B|nr:ABC transporter ATP-binding protein [Bosea sp. (in: a-proteobacteria)]MCO5091346.1 ABC transporter ATP-binding protein [Bosea sp. (in: a-proteobacteria)]